MRFEEYNKFHKNEKALEQELFRLVESVEIPESKKGGSFFAALKKKIIMFGYSS